jgi:hypothetical protein
MLKRITMNEMGRLPLDVEWATRALRIGPPPSATLESPGRRTGTRSKRNGTERSDIRALGSARIHNRDWIEAFQRLASSNAVIGGDERQGATQ